MSAFVSKVYPDCIQILTDAAIYDHHGVIRAVAPKIWLSKRLPVAIANRSVHWEFASAVSEAFIRAADSSPTVDSFLGLASEICARVKMEVQKHPEVNAETEFLIACRSEALGLSNMYMRTNRATGNGLPADYEPFTLVQAAADIFGAPHDTIPGRPELAAIGEEIMASSAGMARRGADLFELFRRERVVVPSMPEAGQYYAVGGRVDLTTVTTSGAGTKILRIWPDKIGEKIDPSRDRRVDNIVPIATGMNRQQRRAAKRVAKLRAA